MVEADVADFRALVWDHHARHRRSFVWREDTTPYRVYVSEVMLQQTQTARVARKFPEFMARFPDFQSLASASLADVLEAWQGMGYNRRGQALREAAARICGEWDGVLPSDPETLATLPGIGPNTAGSIVAFAFNLPAVFVETNIRAVFLHHFFPDEGVSDARIRELVAATVDRERPREWYYGLMDYGVHIKALFGNPNRRSPSYTRQSAFAGSVRQVRAALLRILLGLPESAPWADAGELAGRLARAPEAADGLDQGHLTAALAGLVADGMAETQSGRYRITGRGA